MKLLLRFSMLLTLIAFGGRSFLAQAIEIIDPACSAPGRGSAVWTARVKLDEQIRRNRHRALKPEGLSPTLLGLNWNAQTHLPQLLLRGPLGQTARVDSTTAIDPVGWQSLLTVNLTANGLDWIDSTAGTATSRFY